jgi:hypothetical protein
LLLVCCGCARDSDSGDDEAARATTRCTGGPSRPIAGDVAVRILQVYGFSVDSSTTSEDCHGFDAAAPRAQRAAFAISNATAGEDVQETEGKLTCILRTGPMWGSRFHQDLDASPPPPAVDGRVAEARFYNVDCRFYPGKSQTEVQIDAFATAMRALHALGAGTSG